MSFAKEKPKKKGDNEKDKPVLVKNAADLQRLKIEKLMKNPDKPVVIPERPREKNTPHVPEFVRNVMGSSAGAGSGEFHVYRHLRRKEYARQKFIQEKAEKDSHEDDYHKKIEDNKRKAEEETAKKRAKRLKKKKNKKFQKPKSGQTKSESESEEEDDDDDVGVLPEKATSSTEQTLVDDKSTASSKPGTNIQVLETSPSIPSKEKTPDKES